MPFAVSSAVKTSVCALDGSRPVVCFKQGARTLESCPQPVRRTVFIKSPSADLDFYSAPAQHKSPLSFSLTHTHTHSHPLSLSLSLAHSHTPTHFLSLSLSHTHALSLSHSLSLSLSHTLSVKPLESGFKKGLSVSNARRPVLRHKPGGGAYMAAVRGCNKDRPPPVYMLRPHNKHRACADQTLERVSVRERERERESAGAASEGLVCWRGSTR